MLHSNSSAAATSAESRKDRQSSPSPERKNAAADKDEALAQPVVPAWSPIVVAGVVRMLEFILIVAVGLTLYAAYLVPIEGLQWRYVGAIFGIGVLAMLALLTVRRRPLFWLFVVAFNLVGVIDLILDYYHAVRVGLPELAGQLGAAYAVPIIYVPVLMITHVVAFFLLLRPQPKAVQAFAADATASPSM